MLLIGILVTQFVAHPNCQQVLRGAWLEGWQSWRQMSFTTKLLLLLPRVIFLPLMALLYLLVPNSQLVTKWRAPFNKFFSFTASYIIFLLIVFVQNGLDTMHSERGPPNTGISSIFKGSTLYCHWLMGQTWYWDAALDQLPPLWRKHFNFDRNSNNNKHLYSACSTECAHRRFTVEWQVQAFTLKKNKTRIQFWCSYKINK